MKTGFERRNGSDGGEREEEKLENEPRKLETIRKWRTKALAADRKTKLDLKRDVLKNEARKVEET